MLVQPLGSGSKGNAIWVESGETRLLIDAGLPAKELIDRIRAAGHQPKKINAVFLSHLHHDHVRGIRRVAKLSGAPVFFHRTHWETRAYGSLADRRSFTPGEARSVGEIEVEAFPVPHDAPPTVGFVMRSSQASFGFLTDAGHVDRPAIDALQDCDALYLEFNHDAELLAAGPYPELLKKRITSDLGHLSNEQAATLLSAVAGPRTRAVFLGHLSDTNNRPDLAVAAARSALEGLDLDHEVLLRVALQNEPTEPLRLTAREESPDEVLT